MSGIVKSVPVSSTRQHTDFASGTKMVFNQTAAPTGWTKSTAADDVALRLVSGSAGTGGSVAFETAFASHTPSASGGAVANHTLTTAQLASHEHTHWPTMWEDPGSYPDYRFYNSLGGGSNAQIQTSTTSSAGSGNSHNHSFTQPTISAVNLDVSYVDVIIATKD